MVDESEQLSAKARAKAPLLDALSTGLKAHAPSEDLFAVGWEDGG